MEGIFIDSDILSILIPDGRVQLEGLWCKPPPSMVLVKYEDLTMSSSMESQQLEETGEERFPLHEACWEGRTEFLLEQLGLDGSKDVLFCPNLEKLFQQNGRVPVCFDKFGHGPSHEYCPQEMGSLILLAVKRRDFALAITMLSALLYRRIKRIQWSDQNYPQWKWEEPRREMLRKLLWYILNNHAHSFSFMFREDLGPISEPFLTLVTACLLGDKELVEAIMEMFPYSEWHKLNEYIFFKRYRNTKYFVEKASLVCTSLGGDPGCLGVLKEAFPHPWPFGPAVLRENVLKIVWPWQMMEVPKFLHCLDDEPSLASLESVSRFAWSILKDPLVQFHGPYLSEAQMKQNFAIELVELLWCATKRMLGQRNHQSIQHRRTVAHLRWIAGCFGGVEPESKIAELLHASASYALYLQAPGGILEEKFADELLMDLKGDDRQKVLHTLCQFWLATRSRFAHSTAQDSVHGQVYTFVKRRLASDENLEDLKTLATFCNIPGTVEFQELLKSAATECRSRRLISFQDETSSLQHIGMLSLLQKMDRENKLFHELGVPRGLNILTMNNFLKCWHCLAYPQFI